MDTKVLFISFIISGFCCQSHNCIANSSRFPDSTAAPAGNDFIQEQVEYLAARSGGEVDLTALLEDYHFYLNNPVNLNGGKLRILIDLHLITQMQLNNINSYVHRYGRFYSVHELENIPGIDRTTYQNLIPFVIIGKPAQREKVTLRKFFTQSRHRLIVRYSQVAEPVTGQQIPRDSALFNPGIACLGTPQAYYVRYAFRFRDKLRLGITLDKDAGEVMLRAGLDNEVLQQIGKKIHPVFDFRSGFIMVSEMGVLEKLIIGDFHLAFGQGLTLWSGMAFGKSTEGTRIRRFGRGIIPNTSTNENRFFRGVATTLRWRFFRLTGFYSKNQVDALIRPLPLTGASFNSLQESGKHRTVNELLNRDALDLRSAGGSLGLNIRKLHLGLTIFQTAFGAAMAPAKNPYASFGMRGRSLLNSGLDFNVVIKNTHLFGELSRSHPGGYAGIVGMYSDPEDRLSFALSLRYLAPNYHNLFNNPIRENSKPSNEYGMYFGFSLLTAKHLKLSGYLDYLHFPWLKYGVDTPSTGYDMQVQLSYTPQEEFSIQLRIRYRKRQENSRIRQAYTNKQAEADRHGVRCSVSYRPLPSITLRNRIEWVHYAKEGTVEQGYLLYQDILYRPLKLPLQLTFRYALFSTGGDPSRIYAYEYDVLYAFSVPSFSGRGQRWFLLARFSINQMIDLWLRFARVTYADRSSIGTGCDKINGNSKSEVKVQLAIKL